MGCELPAYQLVLISGNPQQNTRTSRLSEDRANHRDEPAMATMGSVQTFDGHDQILYRCTRVAKQDPGDGCKQ